MWTTSLRFLSEMIGAMEFFTYQSQAEVKNRENLYTGDRRVHLLCNVDVHGVCVSVCVFPRKVKAWALGVCYGWCLEIGERNRALSLIHQATPGVRREHRKVSSPCSQVDRWLWGSWRALVGWGPLSKTLPVLITFPFSPCLPAVHSLVSPPLKHSPFLGQWTKRAAQEERPAHQANRKPQGLQETGFLVTEPCSWSNQPVAAPPSSLLRKATASKTV